MPGVLLPSDPQIYAEFIQSLEYVRFAVKNAESHNFYSEPPKLGTVRGGTVSPVALIRDALAPCPDEIAPVASNELMFIEGPEFRKALLIDLEATRAALRHEEWKAATVLAGSIVEALLLWAIQKRDQDDIDAAYVAAATANKWKHQSRILDILRLDLSILVEIADQMKLIEPDTTKQVRLAKDFRNLIHPGRVIRMRQACDRGTALAANAAMALVARDLGV